MAEQVLPGVYRIKVRLGYVNVYLIVADELVLVDSGLPGQTRRILAAVREAGRRPEELRHIAITHLHVDHTGSLEPLVKATKARVYVHPLDAAVTSGKQPVPGPNPGSVTGNLMWPVIKRISPTQLSPLEIDHEVQDGEVLSAGGGMRVIHTPGHTAGHVAYLWQGAGGVLFAGDAAGQLFGRLGLPAPMFTEDMEQARQSVRKLAELEFDSACFGHGGVLKGKANAAFRRYVEKMAG